MTPEQARMARALLRLTIREVATAAKVDKDTIVSIEAGRRGHAGPVKRIREYLESQGIFFIPGLDTMHGPAVALRWGFEPPVVDQDGSSAGEGADEEGGVQATAWDEEESALLGPKDIENLRRYWAESGRWERLSEPSKKALRRAMGQPHAL